MKHADSGVRGGHFALESALLGRDFYFPQGLFKVFVVTMRNSGVFEGTDSDLVGEEPGGWMGRVCFRGQEGRL